MNYEDIKDNEAIIDDIQDVCNNVERYNDDKQRIKRQRIPAIYEGSECSEHFLKEVDSNFNNASNKLKSNQEELQDLFNEHQEIITDPNLQQRITECLNY